MTEHNLSPDETADTFQGAEKAFKDALAHGKQDLKDAAVKARQEQVERGAVMARAIHVLPDVLMKFPADCSCVPAAVRRVLFAGDATGARFTA